MILTTIAPTMLFAIICGFLFIGLAIREFRKPNRFSHIKKIQATVLNSELTNVDGFKWSIRDSEPYFLEKDSFSINGNEKIITRKTSVERFEGETAKFYYDTKNYKVAQKPTINFTHIVTNITYAIYSFILSYVAYCFHIGKINLTNSYLHEALLIASMVSFFSFLIIIYISIKENNIETDELQYKKYSGKIVGCKCLSVKDPRRYQVPSKYERVLYTDIIEYNTVGGNRRCIGRPSMGRIVGREGEDIEFFIHTETGEISGMVKTKTSIMSGIWFLATGIFGLLWWYAISLGI